MADRQVQSPQVIRLEDYKVTDFVIDSFELDFTLHETQCIVKSRLQVRRNPNSETSSPSLQLHGEELQLLDISVDGNKLAADAYRVDEDGLCLDHPPQQFELRITTQINPEANTSLNGLYLSGGNFCTQCEAEGFRRITYMYDRPDVLTRYTTRLRADKRKYPVLLSNGNLIESGDCEDDGGMHYAVWVDPFPKPTYLFALVAGDLTRIEDKFTTMSGREVDLHIFVQSHNADKCDHAMRSLKNAMAWDEKVYGREYDLDVYMIVAVDDFNMGAMENKGLNVFNSKCVLAKPDTATDNDYLGIEGVVGHEYFHNWSGNRVTCRDWFQLSLKEGFTVFRDQEFSADMSSAGVKRISDVNVLRNHQFREDAGPMAHPVRPDSYVEINNFYTVTIYNKGAEVVRMLHHLLGAQRFRRGTDLYFERHDGQAVTTEDFVRALEDANQVDFSQFRLWYSQAGTPKIKVTTSYHAEEKRYRISFEQSCPATPGQAEKKPFYIPVAVGLLDAQGRDMALQVQAGAAVENAEQSSTTKVLHLSQARQSFDFINVAQEPVASILRGFSAPVKIEHDISREQRAFLMAHDSDDFNRWDAGQQLAVEVALELLQARNSGQALTMDPLLINGIEKILDNDAMDLALAAQAICLPSESYIADAMDEIDPLAVYEVREFMCRSIARSLKGKLLDRYTQYHELGEYRIDQQSIGRRAFKNTCLSYLVYNEDATINDICVMQYHQANNMTDKVTALAQIVNFDDDIRDPCFDQFYQQWKHDSLVIDKWLSLQAISKRPDTLKKVQALTAHEAFNLRNPNKVRSLIGSFCGGNARNFHAADGSGYRFLADYVLALDKTNPQIAARLCSVFGLWRRYDRNRRELLQQELLRIQAQEKLSKDVYELVNKSLA